jgi:hypothetical protein
MRSPELSLTVVPITLDARIADVCPVLVVMVCLLKKTWPRRDEENVDAPRAVPLARARIFSTCVSAL